MWAHVQVPQAPRSGGSSRRAVFMCVRAREGAKAVLLLLLLLAAEALAHPGVVGSRKCALVEAACSGVCGFRRVLLPLQPWCNPIKALGSCSFCSCWRNQIVAAKLRFSAPGLNSGADRETESLLLLFINQR